MDKQLAYYFNGIILGEDKLEYINNKITPIIYIHAITLSQHDHNPFFT